MSQQLRAPGEVTQASQVNDQGAAGEAVFSVVQVDLDRSPLVRDSI